MFQPIKHDTSNLPTPPDPETTHFNGRTGRATWGLSTENPKGSILLNKTFSFTNNYGILFP